ncbi:MAG TPA: endonuclease/exonuclease/phosphatase family protein, partial [Nannocystis sp.]
GGLDPRLDLASHFRAHYAALAALALVLAAALRLRRWALLAGLLLAAELTQVAPLWFGRAEPAGPAVLRLLHFNLLSQNPHKDDVVAWIAATGADLVLALEVDPAWAEALARVPGYDVLEVVPRRDNFGIALLVRHDRRDMVSETSQDDLLHGIPALVAELSIDGRTIALLGVHPPPPIDAGHAAARDFALRAVGEWVQARRRGGAVPIVLGDLNATPWSAPLRRLLADTGLVDSQRGFGLQPSWPASGLFPRIAIDHCLHDRALTTVARALGPALGSDHLPLRVDLAWSKGHGPGDTP